MNFECFQLLALEAIILTLGVVSVIILVGALQNQFRANMYARYGFWVAMYSKSINGFVDCKFLELKNCGSDPCVEDDTQIEIREYGSFNIFMEVA